MIFLFLGVILVATGGAMLVALRGQGKEAEPVVTLKPIESGSQPQNVPAPTTPDVKKGSVLSQISGLFNFGKKGLKK